MPDSTLLRDSIMCLRASTLPGVEIIESPNCRETERIFSTTLGVGLIGTWKGDVVYRGSREPLGPDMLFCAEPGEVHVTTPHAGTGGSYRVFLIEGETLRGYLAEYGKTPRSPGWKEALPSGSPEIRQRMVRVFRAIHDPVTPMRLQTGVAELIETLQEQLLVGPHTSAARLDVAPKAADRIRDCIHDDVQGMDLHTLARATGLSRFQVLRSFKRRFGLPPHAYQLCLRVMTAQKMLRRGDSPANVAARCGFVDQSHLTRHFRRILGVTPGQYASASKTRTDHSCTNHPVDLMSPAPSVAVSRYPVLAIKLAGGQRAEA